MGDNTNSQEFTRDELELLDALESAEIVDLTPELENQPDQADDILLSER